MAYGVFTQLDFSQEKSGTKIYAVEVTAANFDAFNTEFDQMRNAIAGICSGTMSDYMWVGENVNLSNTQPTNVYAQREIKWKVNYVDNVTQSKHFVTLPCADPTARLIAGTDLADLTQTQMASFKTRFESFAKSPDNAANGVTIISIQLVGRNL